MQDIDFNKIKTSKKKFYSKPNNAYKHYIVYDYNDEAIPLLTRLPEMIGCYKVFKGGKTMNFTFDDKELLQKYEELFEDVSNKIGKEFFTEPTFENEYDTHIYKNRTRFYDNETPEKDTNYRRSALIRIESVYFTPEKLKYYP